MKKVLFVATVVKTHIMPFHIPFIKWFKEQGYETFVAARNDYENQADCKIPYCDHFIDINFQRNPFTTKNIDAYQELKKLIDHEKFSIIHCNTPVGGVLTRLAAKQVRKRDHTKVIYMAHGFHFYTGAPFQNWLLYYPVEYLCAKHTDTIITMNDEDYHRAKKFPCNDIRKIDGVGIDLLKVESIQFDKEEIRKSIGADANDFIILSVGELSKRKNQIAIIKAFEKINISDAKYYICGDGPLREFLKDEIKKRQLQNRVILLGYRTDIIQLCKSADLFAFPSYHEGLPVSVMEAMACGLPCVVSNIRGSRDLIDNEKGGFVVNQDVDDYANAIRHIYKESGLKNKFGTYNKAKIKQYDIHIILKEMAEIYRQYM